MAVHKGSEGTVKVGTSSISEIVDWSLSESADVIDTSSMGDTARTFTSSLTTATGSISVRWDETDTSGQGAMTVGAEVTLNLYPEGADSGDTYATLSAIITEAGKSASFDGLVEASFSFTANGAVTWGTVA
jgi:hypothetical protein